MIPVTPVRILLNCPDRETARSLAAALLDARLVACANIYPEVESHFVWQGARQVETEVPLVLKSRADLMPRIERKVAELHPYEVPPLVAQNLDLAHRPFVDWVAEMTDADS
jgi:periplasmic divalent cation tolerance protein